MFVPNSRTNVKPPESLDAGRRHFCFRGNPTRPESAPRKAHSGPEPSGGDSRSRTPRPVPPEREFPKRIPRKRNPKSRFPRHIPGPLRPAHPGSRFPARGPRNAVSRDVFPENGKAERRFPAHIPESPGCILGHPGSCFSPGERNNRKGKQVSLLFLFFFAGTH